MDLLMREQDVFKGPFCLVSYSHRDAKVVRDDINALINDGARIWIDHRDCDEDNMSYGDNWKEKIKTALNHENCVGAFIYISPYSLAGRATQWEQEQIFNKGNLKTYLISINSEDRETGTSIKRHYKLASDLCDEDDSTEPIFINPDYAYEIKPKQEKWINPKNEELYINRLSSEVSVAELKKIAVSIGIISNTAKTANEIMESSRAQYNGKISFGIYKSTEAHGVMPDTKGIDGRFMRSRETYFSMNGKVFTTKPLSWRLLYTCSSDDAKVFISSEVVDDYSGDKLSEFLDIFSAFAFSKEEAAIIKKLRIPAEADFKQTEEACVGDALKLPKEQRGRSWWIDDPGLLPAWKKLYKDNVPYGQGFLQTLKKGVRPIIEIGSAEFEKLIEMIKVNQ